MSPQEHADNDTKTRILNAAVGIMLEKGFHGVGINEILAAVKVPKGSFYHWFASKEDFGVALLRHYAAQSLADKKSWQSKKEVLPNARERILAYMEAGVCSMLSKDCSQVCLMTKLMAEVSSFSEAMREELTRSSAEFLALNRDVITEGQQQGSITKTTPSAELAVVIHDLWVGAYMRAATTRSIQPMKDAIAFVGTLLKP